MSEDLLIKIIKDIGVDKPIKDIILAVVSCMDDPDPDVRYLATQAFIRLYSLNLEDIPPLVSLLKHEDFRVRFCAARILEDIGPPAKEAIPVLKRLLENDKHIKVRQMSQLALHSINKTRRKKNGRR